MSDSPDSHATFPKHQMCTRLRFHHMGQEPTLRSLTSSCVYVHQNEYNAVYNITDYFSWIFNFTMKASNQHKLSLKFTSLSRRCCCYFFYTIPALIFNGRTPARAAYMVKYVWVATKKTRWKRISHFTHARRLSNQRALHQPFAVLLWQQTSVDRTFAGV